MADSTGLQYTFVANSLSASTLSVVAFELKEGLSEPYELSLELATQHDDIAFPRVLDDSAELQIWYNGELTRRVHGLVTRFARNDTGHQRTRYSVTLRPDLWLLSLEYHPVFFSSKRHSKLLRNCCKRQGSRHFIFLCVTIIRYANTVFSIVNPRWILSLASRPKRGSHGISALRETPMRWSLLMTTPSYQKEALPWNSHKRGLNEGASVQRFSYEENLRVSQVLLKEYTFKNPAWAMLYREQGSTAPYRHHQMQHYDYPGRYKTDFNGDAYSGYRLDALRRDAMQAHGVSDSPSLTAGDCFSLTSHPHDDFNRVWQIVSLHTIGQQSQSQEEESGAKGTWRKSFHRDPG
jgi:type VI secretion system secreted protein VgrG